MRVTSRAGLAALALACSVAFASGSAIAQTSAPQSPGAAAGFAPQSQVNPSPDQVSAFIKELGSFVSQSVSGFQPQVGAPAPKELKTQPMPSGAAAAIPDLKDHHVAKTDDQTILIVDPVTRQIVGVIQAVADGSGTAGQGNTQPGPGGSGAPSGNK
jgi:hypothetical protein